MNFSIVEARADHVDRIEEIEQQCFSLPWTRQMLESQLDGDRHIFLAAVDGEELLGYVGMMFVLDEAYISNVAVAPEHRRRGIAQSLISELSRRAREKGLSFMTLEVREGNAAAISLYKKQGFKEVGLRKNYYDKPRENAILMTLELD